MYSGWFLSDVRYRCSGKFVASENYSHVQQYGLGLRLRIGLNLGLWLGLGVGLRLRLGLGLGLRLGLGLGLALVTLWQYGGGKNCPGATNFLQHRLVLWRHLGKWFACRFQLRKLLVVCDLRLWPPSADNEISVYSKQQRTETNWVPLAISSWLLQTKSPPHFPRFLNLIEDFSLNIIVSWRNANKS